MKIQILPPDAIKDFTRLLSMKFFLRLKLVFVVVRLTAHRKKLFVQFISCYDL